MTPYLIRTIPPEDQTRFHIDMIDVGQGDAFLLTFKKGARRATVLIDGGRTGQGDVVADFVKRWAGGHLSAVIATHPDADHIGGLPRVLERCEVEKFYYNEPPDLRKATLTARRLVEEHSDSYVGELLEKSLLMAMNLKEALRRNGITPQSVLAKKYWKFGDVRLRVLNPTTPRLAEAWRELESQKRLLREVDRLEKSFGGAITETSAQNDASVVLELEYKGRPYALFAADASSQVLREVTNGKSYTFLKVPHHGSQTGLDYDLFEQLAPRVAYISVGPNPYGHPDRGVLEALRTVGATTYCSEKTKSCWRDCPRGGFGSMRHPNDRSFLTRKPADALSCMNNQG
jgi:competence protein ComEC